jgi:hypothetical protein
MNPDTMLKTLRTLTREAIEQRLAEIEAERAQLISIRRSIVARERARRRHVQAKEVSDAE